MKKIPSVIIKYGSPRIEIPEWILQLLSFTLIQLKTCKHPDHVPSQTEISELHQLFCLIFPPHPLLLFGIKNPIIPFCTEQPQWVLLRTDVFKSSCYNLLLCLLYFLRCPSWTWGDSHHSLLCTILPRCAHW